MRRKSAAFLIVRRYESDCENCSKFCAIPSVNLQLKNRISCDFREKRHRRGKMMQNGTKRNADEKKFMMIFFLKAFRQWLID